MIDKLNMKLKSALRSRSKSVTFTTEEVSELILELNEILMDYKKISQELRETNTGSVKVDIVSGKF